MDDITRYLQYSSVQATQAGHGLSAELHALQLVGTLYAEKLQDSNRHHLEASLMQSSLQLLVQANATQQAAAARAQRLQAAAERAGLPANYMLPASVQLPKLSAAACNNPQLAAWQQLLHMGRETRQLMQQVSKHISAASTCPAGPGEASSEACRPMDVPVAAADAAHSSPLDRVQGGPPAFASAAASKWGAPAHVPMFSSAGASSTAAAAAAADGQRLCRPAKRGLDQARAPGNPQQHGQQYPVGNQDDPIITCGSSSDEDYKPQRKQAHQQPWQQAGRRRPAVQQQGGRGGLRGPMGAAAGGPPEPEDNSELPDQLQARTPGFMTARNQLVNDLHKKGQHQQAAALQSAAPRAGLSKGRGRGAGAGGPVGRASRGGFVPPFMNKAIEHQTGQGMQGAGGEEGPLSARTLELLGVAEVAELPPELARHDPRLIEQVCNEVIDTSGGVSWEDIAGLHTAKALVNEVVVWPMLNPGIFTGPRAPPKGLLLFGPPGTGKTLIGKAIASNIQASFFSISASSLTSKWIGEGEKLVKTLFAVAGWLQPSVIFIDEIDSILSARKSDGEHEASRRLKTEMLVQMEGCDPTSSQRRVLLIGATNRPEELDEAARRRMPKQLYIPLPCSEARRAMIERQLGAGASVAAQLSPADLEKIVAKTAGYSGSDMRNLIQEACQGPVRDAVTKLGNRVAELSSADLRAVMLRDFQQAAKAQRASVTPAEIVRYEEYNERHGAKYTEGGAPAEAEEDEW